MAIESIAGKFWARVNKTDTCWLWTAGVAGRTGYGAILYNGCMRGAHRISWELTHGPIPNGLYVLHQCDVRRCVNPAHLFLGTNADNMADKIAKGRQERGEWHHGVKLSEADVLAIRADTRVQREIAIDFGVSQTQVGRIRRGVRWKHVTSSPP